tara:strand:+ start:252 stop:455 length:204 start_codon:yes stop_codon:yes gene_type:complete
MDKNEKIFRKVLKRQLEKCGLTPSEVEKELQRIEDDKEMTDLFDSMFPEGPPSKPSEPFNRPTYGAL